MRKYHSICITKEQVLLGILLIAGIIGIITYALHTITEIEKIKKKDKKISKKKRLTEQNTLQIIPKIK